MKSIFKMLKALSLGALVFSALAHTTKAETWTVSGTVQVQHKLTKLVGLYGDSSPLGGIEVKVSGRSKVWGVWGTWNSWDTTTTKTTGATKGSFSVSEVTGSGERQVKVEVRFKSDDLTIRDAEIVGIDSSRWYKIYQGQPSSRTVALGNLTFKSGGSYDLGDSEAREQADYWVLASLIMDTMADFGYPFLKELVIEHGWHNPFSDQSYCNPLDGVVHIEKNDFNSYTVIHEVMHRWLYDHMEGESELGEEIWKENQTHCFQGEGKSWVSFVEGFSEFCEVKLGEIMFGDDAPLPFNHNILHSPDPDWTGCDDIFNSATSLELSCFGWNAVFRLITTHDVARYDFNGAGNCVDQVADAMNWFYLDPQLDFDAVLRAITGSSSTGELDKDNMNIEDFLALVVEENYDSDTVNEDTIEAWLKLLDPIYTYDSWDLFDLASFGAWSE